MYQLVGPELRRNFPALSSLDELPNNLPCRLTSFIGRDDVLSEIRTLMESSVLVTLVGAGGVGKTRCALQAGADLLEAMPDGVWLVEMAAFADPAFVQSASAQALGLGESTRHVPDAIVTHLKRKRALLVLDNCEHVIGEVRSIVAAIVRHCPEARILATSRETLNIAGERVLRIPSLTVPAGNRALTAHAALEYGAVALFAERAGASGSRFTLSDDDAPFVAEICRRLDGIPLALELAAAKVKVLTPRGLARRLDERFRLLTGGDRAALPRQQTMLALIDWSYDHLSSVEQNLFRRLSIFEPSFSLDVAGQVCAGATLDELAVLDLLSSLVDKSLVQAEPVGGEIRYRLLESTRQYAREKLLASGESDALARAHASAYAQLAERVEGAWPTSADRTWDELAGPEVDNWRAAMAFTLKGGGDVVVGQRLAGALRRGWWYSAGERQRWVRRALEQAGDATPPGVMAKLELAEATLAVTLGQYTLAQSAAERAVSRYRELDDRPGMAEAERYAGLALLFLGRLAEGEVRLKAALACFRKLGALKLTGGALRDLAYARGFAGDVAGARTFFADALTIFKATGAERAAGSVAADLAEVAFRDGDAETAVRTATEALAAWRPHGDARSTALHLNNLAAYLVALGRYDEARANAREALAVSRSAGHEVHVAFVLQHLAAVAALRDDRPAESARSGLSCAASLLGYVDARLAALEALREYTEQQEYDRVGRALASALGSREQVQLMDQGREWSEEQAISAALAL
ncbi:MAG: tetratricopeptide repeat protein [Candidatus Eremiobacteraeota bacterium]|nr:tetratricopeptide repeat protein [Candidatus Eremiobacteraeota bacterium]